MFLSLICTLVLYCDIFACILSLWTSSYRVFELIEMDWRGPKGPVRVSACLEQALRDLKC